MSGSDHKENRNNDYPSITEADWYVLAIVSSIFTFVGAGFALWWILHGVYPDKVTERSTIAGMIVTFGGVVTTFCTVAWRGMITTRQADVSIQQIAETRRQIAVTVDNNLALTLQKGAEFIAEEDNEAKTSAGIAMLYAVINSRSDLYTSVAYSLLATFIKKNGTRNHNSSLVRQCINSLNNLHDRFDLISNERFFFSSEVNGAGDYQYANVEWVLMQGPKSVHYEGGNIRLQEISNKHDRVLVFEEVRFYGCKVQDINSMGFDRCEFRDCSFTNVRTDFLSLHKFIRCNFSDTEISGRLIVGKLSENGNYYYEGNPPIGVDIYCKTREWDKIFKVRKNIN